MAISDEARRERARCVAICRRRADLWNTTLMAHSSVRAAQEEARARANEATYLADLIESGKDPDDDPPSVPGIH